MHDYIMMSNNIPLSRSTHELLVMRVTAAYGLCKSYVYAYIYARVVGSLFAVPLTHNVHYRPAHAEHITHVQ